MNQIDFVVQSMEEMLRYRFRNRNLLVEALTQNASINTRLAWHGDVVAKMIIADAWVKTGNSPAIANDLVIKHLSNANLARHGESFIIPHLLCNGGINSAAASQKMIATAVEAVFAAVPLDAGDDSRKGVANVAAVMRLMNIGVV